MKKIIKISDKCHKEIEEDILSENAINEALERGCQADKYKAEEPEEDSK